jgi:O-antigen/teichoic acid export membrane protein
MALVNLALIFINARLLNIDGVGLIGVIWSSVSINVTINSLFSGNALVYFVHRYSVRQLYTIAVAWILAGSAIGCGTLLLTGMMPDGYAVAVYLLTVIYSLSLCHTRLLLGRDDILGFNVTNLFQGGVLFVIMMIIYFVIGIRSVNAYVTGLFIANALALVISTKRLLPYFGADERQDFGIVIKDMFGYGLWGSADNLAETLTTRLNYFIVERTLGMAGVGLLDSGTKIAESVWNISRGAANIEYNKVAGLQGRPEEQKRVTHRILAFSTLAVTGVIGIICLLPEVIYTDYLFGKKFAGIRTVILMMSPGIVFFAVNNILSHYFIGSGRIKYSAFTSFVGLVALLIAGYLLIPLMGVNGSAISSSIAYACMAVFALIAFRKQSRS